MPIRNPAPHDPNALRRDLDPQARGLLRDDTPNHWKENLHALSNLSSSEVLNPSTFDQLTAVNKEVVIAHVEHVLDVLNKRYYRRGVPPDIDVFQIRKGVFFVRTEEMWDKMIGLAKRPGAGGATATDPAARDFWDYLRCGLGSGDLVDGSALEKCFEHGRGYSAPVQTARHEHPMLNVKNLDSDDVHAFLCAYETCFHLRTHGFFPFWRRLLQRIQRKRQFEKQSL